jgi:hypothetical protein
MTVEARVTPESFTVTEPCDVEVAITCSEELRPGDAVEAQFPHSWTLVSGPSHTRALQTDEPALPHHVSVTADGATFDVAITPRQVNFPEGGTRHGRLITATVREGAVPAGATITLCYANTVAPYVFEKEELWLRVRRRGDGQTGMSAPPPEAPAEAPRLITRGGPAVATRIIVPSGVEPGEMFDVLVVSLDKFENVSSSKFVDRELVLADSGAPVVSGLAFTGSIRVPVALDEPGVYRFVMDGTVSNAVKVAEGRRGPFWGDIHIHTKLSGDGQGTDPYGYAHHVAGLDFGAACDHWDSLGPEGYRIIERWAADADEPGTFVVIPADERNPSALTGHHNLYFRDWDTLREHRALAGEALFDDPTEESAYLAQLDHAKVMLVPHHTGITFGDWKRGRIGAAVDWDAWDDPGLRPVLEIYSHHGQSETYAPQHILAYEFNRMRNPERRANTSTPGPHYAQDWWMEGLRLGCIASSDEHCGQGGRRHSGIAAVWADQLTREGVFDAIRQRRCYATTGERILVEFTVGDVAMGDCGQARAGTVLPVRLKVWGTDRLVRVELLRYRFGEDDAFVPIASVSPRLTSGKHIGHPGPLPETLDATIEMDDTLQVPCVYYARVLQEPLDWPGMAWSSPVWMDLA